MVRYPHQLGRPNVMVVLHRAEAILPSPETASVGEVAGGDRRVASPPVLIELTSGVRKSPADLVRA